METFDPFAVLGLERRYAIDRGEVERAYLRRSVEVHPDLHAGSGDEELAGELVARINRARQVLEDAEKRAVALWKLLGGVEDKGLPPGFLMEMMEVREQIEAARGSGDPGAIGRWESWADERRSEYQERVGGLFAEIGGEVGSDAGVLRRIKLELNGWRYIERLIEQLHGR